MCTIYSGEFKMTLAQKIADIKTLLAKLDEGWVGKKLFDNDEVDYEYPDSPDKDIVVKPSKAPSNRRLLTCKIFEY